MSEIGRNVGMTLIDNIKKFAKLRGYNLSKVAEKAGLSQNAIYNWKNHTPSKATISEVAKVLDVTYEDLTGEKKGGNEGNTATKIDLKASIDDEDVIMTYDGQPIPKEDLEIIKRLLRRD